MPGTKIQNPISINVPNSPAFNDRDILNDVLATEKYLTDSFNVFAREASHQSLRQDVLTVLSEDHQCLWKVYETMFRKGLYPLESSEPQQVQQLRQQFTDYQSQFPY